jgi:hypothetical protein
MMDSMASALREAMRKPRGSVILDEDAETVQPETAEQTFLYQAGHQLR